MLSGNEVMERVKAITKRLALRDAETVVEQSGRWLHILIATPDFEGKTASERENIIWREFEEQFDDETILAITQCYLMTAKERLAVAPRGQRGTARTVRQPASVVKVTSRDGTPARRRQPGKVKSST
jgi:hypothetical protein